MFRCKVFVLFLLSMTALGCPDNAGNKPPGAPCLENADCSDQLCHRGVCTLVNGLSNGESCVNDYECQSFNCKNTLCVDGTQIPGQPCRFDIECANKKCIKEGQAEGVCEGTASGTDGGVTDGLPSEERQYIPCPNFTTLSKGNITQDTTLDGCYIVETNIIVSQGILTIASGSTLKFKQGYSLKIEKEGALNAPGTLARPILLTGFEAKRGHWNGVQLVATTKPANQLTYVTVEYAGNSGANLMIYEGAKVAIDDCILRESSSLGFNFTTGSIVTSFKNNIITKNAKAGFVHINSLGMLDTSSTYKGNDADVVGTGEQYGRLEAAQTIKAIDVDYLVIGNFKILVPLTIEAGARLVFEKDASVEVDTEGSLTAVGTETKPIIFTSEKKERGFWQGVLFKSNKSANKLTYLTLEYGGTGYNGNLLIDPGASVSVEHCSFENSVEYGFVIRHDGAVTSFKHNQITKNAKSGFAELTSSVGMLDKSSSYKGNDADAVVIQPWGSKWLSVEQTWQKLDVPYLIMETITLDAPLTIEAGATLLFEQEAGMYVGGDGTNGSLTAIGTANEHVTFDGAKSTPGYWLGLLFWHSNSTKNQLSYVDVKNGGKSNGNLYVSYKSKADVKNCLFSGSSQYGIYIEKGGQVNDDISSANTFSNNQKENVYVAQ